MQGNSETGAKIASFFVDVQVVFNFDEQFSKLQAQIRDFASRMGSITIPVRLAPISQASYEIAAMGAGESIAMARGGRMGSGRNTWRDPQTGMSESELTSFYKNQGYKQTDAGWQKSSSAGMGGLAGVGSMMGFVKSNAAFMATFAAIGDLFKGAQLDRQAAVLQVLIPNQQEYVDVMQKLGQTANLTSTNIGEVMHGFVAFANAARNAGVSMPVAVNAFQALNVAIAGTNSQQQAYRMYQDYMAMVLNPDKISLARIERSDLNTHGGLVKSLENEMGIHDIKALSDAFNQLNKTQQLNAISAALEAANIDVATASQNTLAGRFTEMTNSFEMLGAIIVNDITPVLKPLIDLLVLLADSMTYDFQLLGQAEQSVGKFLHGFGGGADSSSSSSFWNHGIGAIFNPWSHANNPTSHHVTVNLHNNSSYPVKASIAHTSPQASATFHRTAQ